MEPGLRDRENGDLAGNREAGRGAAMEPGLRDRENLYQDTGHMDTVKAAMEPGLRDRENPHVITDHAPPCSPQWSPACETGKTSKRLQCTFHLRCRNGARPERPGKPSGVSR